MKRWSGCGGPIRKKSAGSGKHNRTRLSIWTSAKRKSATGSTNVRRRRLRTQMPFAEGRKMKLSSAWHHFDRTGHAAIFWPPFAAHDTHHVGNLGGHLCHHAIRARRADGTGPDEYADGWRPTRRCPRG